MYKTITISPHNPKWKKQFQQAKDEIALSLKDNLLEIHHIGSTAIEGLIAKPKIDIIATADRPKCCIVPLDTIGYEYKGEWNIPFKYGFTKRGEVDINLHIFEENHPEVELNLLFRDYLRSHPSARDQYAQLKQNLLKDGNTFKKIASHLSAYNLGKNLFITNILKKTGFSRHRFLKCTHHLEWEKAKDICKLNQIEINKDIGVHFVFYQGLTIVGYAQVMLNKYDSRDIHILISDPPHKNAFEITLNKWINLQEKVL